MATTSLSKGSFPVLLLVAALPAISAGVQGYYRPVIGPGLGVLEKIDSPCFSRLRCYVTPPIVYGYVYVPAPRVYGPALYGRRPYAPGAYAPRPYPVRPNPYARYYGFPQTLRRYYRRPPAGAAPPDGPPPASASAPKTAAGQAPGQGAATQQQRTQAQVPQPTTAPQVPETPQAVSTTQGAPGQTVEAPPSLPPTPAPSAVEQAGNDTANAPKTKAPRRRSGRYR